MTYLNSLWRTARFGVVLCAAGFALKLLAWLWWSAPLAASLFWLLQMAGAAIFLLSPLLALPHYALSRRWSD